MPSEFTRGDALRDFLTGAASDGGVQTDPTLSLGNYHSATQGATYGIALSGTPAGVTVEFASGGNPPGVGALQAVDANNLRWQPPGYLGYGPPSFFSGTNVRGLVEGPDGPGKFVRVQLTTPLTPAIGTVTLSILANGPYGFPNVSIADAAAGLTTYRALICKNVSPGTVTNLKRWIRPLAGPVVTNVGQLFNSGSGIITTSGDLSTWPISGYCQVRKSDGTLREVVYYSARSNTAVSVTARSLLGTSASAGSSDDSIWAVPGIAIAWEPGGVQAAGSFIQTIANSTTSPIGVAWNYGITEATGLSIATLATGQQIGLWLWRQIPAGMAASPSLSITLGSSWSSF